jgi:DNA-directed RNA polymerase subunit M/transcription elongation factor TFIIS
MAAKLECPNCGAILKEEGDEMKLARGEYRVYIHRSTLSGEEGEKRVIECMICGHFARPNEFPI